MLLHFNLPGSVARTREQTQVPQGSHSVPFIEAASSVSSAKSSEERRHLQDPQTLQLLAPWQLMPREPWDAPSPCAAPQALSRKPATTHWLGASSVGCALHWPSPGVHSQLPHPEQRPPRYPSTHSSPAHPPAGPSLRSCHLRAYFLHSLISFCSD